MLVVVFITVVLLGYSLGLLAPKIGLMAYPGEHRTHQQATPMVGGIAIYFGLIIGIALFERDFLNLLPSMTLLCVVGVIDDRYKLPFWLRLIAQAFAAYLMIELTGVQLLSLGQILSDNDVVLGVWSVPLTLFATIGVINAVNMSDGLDGLAGSLLLLVLIALLYRSPHQPSLIFALIAAIGGFLFWNIRLLRPRARIFMGDAGSTLLGFLLAYLLVQYTQYDKQIMPPVTALWLIALPLIDAVAVMLLRPLRGKSPFAADQIHYHHLIQAKGFGVNKTLLIILAIQFILIAIGLTMLLMEVNESIQLIIFLVCFAVYFGVLVRATSGSSSD